MLAYQETPLRVLGLEALFRELRTGRVQYVLVQSVDRVARDQIVCRRLLSSRFEAHGVEVLSVSDGWSSRHKRSAEGQRLIDAILDSLAAFDDRPRVARVECGELFSGPKFASVGAGF